MTVAIANVIGTTSLIGFGSSVTGVTLDGGNIDLTIGTIPSGPLINVAFFMPHAGMITSIAAFLSTTVALLF
ncbi:hypothetical protein PMSD_03100 [Paenibacillus macquariensis subsp. defensor]|uniref:Uncharacterized protein n=1 Tax=Paenibacillus macquariensis TaxID=948756 RepID=A0ABY1K0G7_9BACL|nr:hypothetical protein [Paenibacillus macquariensis]MEC0094300.1 hypothetical protein [Paenibacillus macquariensis]OAB25891.1 hypothetical protein PMSM_27665 [Paenibacillus macquariensis subsp. macquariensis]OAB40047.1 hypothetical protein PMSD_03100 [Paenibacillus macquariensis subsp. defensor]SIR08131.1 hypothetical protein SAMN05421578_106318 [Paenibacillus macquariensis]